MRLHKKSVTIPIKDSSFRVFQIIKIFYDMKYLKDFRFHIQIFTQVFTEKCIQYSRSTVYTLPVKTTVFCDVKKLNKYHKGL